MRARTITSNEIREIIFTETLTRIYMYRIYRDISILDDSFQSLMFFGPPGVGKSALQWLAAKDIAEHLSEERKTEIVAKKISMRISNESAVEIARQVVEGKVIPYVHLYLPQTKIWHLEGTPSPMDNYVEVMGVKVPVNLWRLDAYLIPLLDYTDKIKDVNRVVPAVFVLDEFNMARKDVLNALFQLARSAELGRAKLSPFTVITLLGNTPETNINAARQLAAPLVDRAQNYIVSKPDVAGWIAYMREVYGSKYAQEIEGYLLLNKDEIYVQDPSDPTIIQTPRGWTQVAVRMYVLKKMLAEHPELFGTDKRSARKKYFKHLERLFYSTLIESTAQKLFAFVHSLYYVKIDDIIKNPEKLTELDKPVCAYVLSKATSVLVEKYRKGKGKQKDWVLAKLAELAKYGAKVVGLEAVSIIVAGLPIHIKLALTPHIDQELKTKIGKAARTIEKLREEITV